MLKEKRDLREDLRTWEHFPWDRLAGAVCPTWGILIRARRNDQAAKRQVRQGAQGTTAIISVLSSMSDCSGRSGVGYQRWLWGSLRGREWDSRHSHYWLCRISSAFKPLRIPFSSVPVLIKATERPDKLTVVHKDSCFKKKRYFLQF